MNAENMRNMTDDELEGYAKALGFTLKAVKGHDAKVEFIQKRREKAAELSVLGVNLSIPIKAAHDKRVRDLLTKDERTDEDVVELFRLMLGDEQLQALFDAATDEDGTVDEPALSFAFNSILGSKELKNF